ncbi:sugar ABC transporter ATP-binding protein [Devosia yakushimensis]|uniref:Sugar ABC transporter ATP-binding protein n=1 Tax=Devosia yakushimensis TaxID=470028 RepID=A0ABQ5UJE6_9HYPH|nr:sn-glycerol-3-phosphate ABC transporter ATP-binding protein UgpC [Devosia yakushimensis]GLQ12091.1 sugar ABC transporter ATP-binding protein [Devosia yakushimensis]
MATITLHKIQKSYENVPVVHGIDLEIAEHEFVVLVGPSGCGKSTTLRMIAGLETISGGDLAIGGRRVNELGPGERDIAMVFQNYALYPHMTVEQNISFGLRQRRVPKAEIDQAVKEASRVLGLDPLLKRKPRALSGGQRQRVAMGRAIVRKPQVFLFDEPLSNLDAKLRVQMRGEIKRLHSIYPVTTVYVTHDQVEAMTMADRVVVMNKGVIEQVGPPQELYRNPATKFVAGFIGSPSMNFIPCTVSHGGSGLEAVMPGSSILLPAERSEYARFTGKSVLFGIRPEDLAIGSNGGAGLSLTVTNVETLGFETIIYGQYAGLEICVRVASDVSVHRGEVIPLTPDTAKIHLIDPETGLVIKA